MRREGRAAVLGRKAMRQKRRLDSAARAGIATLALSGWAGLPPSVTARTGAPDPDRPSPPVHAALALAEKATITGNWKAEVGKADQPLSFSIWRSGPDSFFQASSDVPLASLKGLSRDDALRHDASVRFEIVRDAGVFRCDGKFDRGKGSGRWTYAPDATFGADMARRGFENLSEEELFKLAVHDVSRAFCDEMKASGYGNPSFEDLLALRVHDIRRAYVEGLAAAGYPHLPLEELLECRIHEVTPDFIAQLRSLGYDQVPLEELIALRVHEVTIDFIQRQRAKGEKPSLEDLIEMQIHSKKD